MDVAVTMYDRVEEALAAGAEPRLLCATCPWDRYCVTPPTITKADVDRKLEEARVQDEADRRRRAAAGERPDLPVGSLLTALTFDGRHQQATICPVYALRLRSSRGRELVDQHQGADAGLGRRVVTAATLLAPPEALDAPNLTSEQPSLFDVDVEAPATTLTVRQTLAIARGRHRGPQGPTSHRCPALGCGIYVPMRRVACSDHWFSLPQELRDGINATYGRDLRRHLELYREAIRLLTTSTREDHRS
jgi:hypothetical protein